MKKFTDKEIAFIAQELDTGCVCYIHKETSEIKSVIDLEEAEMYGGMELWEKEMEVIEKERDNYFKIERMSSMDAFKVMQRFALQVENKQIQDKLFYALEQRKPFQKFRYEVDYYHAIRQQWFDFKKMKYEEYVRRRIHFGLDEEE